MLPWLSPAANYYLFSPTLGMSSATNTPGGGIFSILKSPSTPNAAIASKLSLPLTTDDIMADSKKKTSAGDAGRSGTGGTIAAGPSNSTATMNGMICVSPLASRKNSNNTTSNTTNANVTHGQLGGGGGGSHQLQNSMINNNTNNNMNSTHTTIVGELSQPDTPINFREVFASPMTDSRTGMMRTDHSNEIPELGSSIMLEKHIAERDVREDEDLNVLLKLAETTPNRKAVETKPSSRSFRNQFAYSNHPRTGLYSQTHGGREPPLSLHLPYIGKNSTKTQTTQNPQADDFTPPPLPIRSNSSSSPNKASTNKTGDNKKGSVPYQRQKSPSSHSKPMYLHPGATHVHHPHVYHQPPPHYIHSHPPYYSYPVPHPGNVGTGHPPPPSYSIYSSTPSSETSSKSPNMRRGTKANKDSSPKESVLKRPSSSPSADKKRSKKPASRRGGKRQRTTVSQPLSGAEREKSAATITAINASTGSKNDKAASLAAAILRGVTMRPSGKWQAQLYYAGKSRYIGVFDTREKAALAYEIAREKLKTDRPAEQGGLSLKETEANVNAARKAAFEGVNEKDPRN